MTSLPYLLFETRTNTDLLTNVLHTFGQHREPLEHTGDPSGPDRISDFQGVCTALATWIGEVYPDTSDTHLPLPEPICLTNHPGGDVSTVGVCVYDKNREVSVCEFIDVDDIATTPDGDALPAGTTGIAAALGYARTVLRAYVTLMHTVGWPDGDVQPTTLLTHHPQP